MSRGAYIAAGLLVAAALVLAYLAGRDAGSAGLAARVAELERAGCAWRVFEDGSATPERDDATRYACMERAR